MAIKRRESSSRGRGDSRPGTGRAHINGLPGVTDLSSYYGWNNDMSDARARTTVARQRREATRHSRHATGAPATRSRLKIAPSPPAVFWPSKKFADSDLIPGGGPPARRPKTMLPPSGFSTLKRNPGGSDSTPPASRGRLPWTRRGAARRSSMTPRRRAYVDVLRGLIDPPPWMPTMGRGGSLRRI